MLSARKLGRFTVSSVGLGCMNLSHAYGKPLSEDAAGALLLRALDLGITHFDTAALYGFGANEQLIGKVLSPHRSRFTLASKGGAFGLASDSGTRRVIDGRPATLRANCEQSLRNLKTDVIDLYYLHRWDKKVPIEESVGELGKLAKEGKIGQIGLSEISADTLRRAHAVHPIAAVQSEYSVVTRNPEIRVLNVCEEIGASFVAFSPLGRGILSTEPLPVDSFEAKDIRRAMPRFEAENYAANYQALSAVRSFAQALGSTPAQLALAWLLHQGPHIVVIPGTAKISHLNENVRADAIELDRPTLQRLNGAIDGLRLRGNRYSEATRAEVDSEEWSNDGSDTA